MKLIASIRHQSSVKVTMPLVEQIVSQTHQLPDDSPIKSTQQAVRGERAKDLESNKTQFCDVIKLRYDWPIDDIQSTCVCGEVFTVDHAMICKRGGFVNAF